MPRNNDRNGRAGRVRSMACSSARSPSLKVKCQKSPEKEPYDTQKRPTDIPTLAQGAKRGTQRAVQRVLVVGPREVPSFILDVDTGDVLWDHRRRPVKEALAIISKLRPYAVSNLICFKKHDC